MKSTCSVCTAPFEIRAEDKAFYAKMSPAVHGKRFEVPPPSSCPNCRQQLRLAFRNERSLYQRRCDLCRKNIISAYSPDKPYPVYCPTCWWSDSWDGSDYAQELSFSRSFLEQYAELSLRVPRIALINTQVENSDYVNQTTQLRNCYLVFSTAGSEDCYYGMRMNRDRNCVDGLVLEGSELCYECILCEGLYDCLFCMQSSSCTSSRFLFDCQNCRDCLMCWNLRSKQYCVRNKQFSKEEYLARRAKLEEQMASYTGCTELRGEFINHVENDAFHQATRQLSCENAIGDNLYNAKDCYYCFQSGDLESCAYTVLVNFSKDTFDANNSYQGELIYNTCTAGIQSYNVLFCIDAWPGHRDTIYCNFCPNGQSLTGCCGLKRGSYSILNKRYSEAEYRELLPRVLGLLRQHNEWGEFFPASYSDFGYNETVAQEHFPLTREKALAAGFRWSDYAVPPPSAARVYSAEDLPDRIPANSDDILAGAIKCASSDRLFRITRAELDFYKKLSLPLPRLHPDVRHSDRQALCNKRWLWERTCGNCGKKIATSFQPERKERVFCRACCETEWYGR